MRINKYTKQKLSRLLLLCFLFSTLTVQPSWADSKEVKYISRVIYPYSDDSKTQLNNSLIALNDLILINGKSINYSSAFDKSEMTLDENGAFSAFFTVKMHGTESDTCNRDSIYSTKLNFNFVLQDLGSTAIGNSIDYNGLAGIDNSLAIAYNFSGADTDSDTDTVKVLKAQNGTVSEVDSIHKVYIPTKYYRNSYPTHIEEFKIWIDYDGTTLETRVSRDYVRPADADLSTTVDLKSILGGNKAYPGFTASLPSGETGNLGIASFYFVPEYAPIDIGTYLYSEYTAPILSSTGISNIEFYGAKATSVISNVAGGTVSEKGFVYGTSALPTTADSKVIDTVSTGNDIGAQITGLDVNTTYYVRSYAITQYGTGYGDQSTFTTGAKGILATPASALTEANLDGATISMAIAGDTLSEVPIYKEVITMNHAPSGVSIDTVTVPDPRHFSVTLSYDGTDFDSDISNMSFTLPAEKLMSGEALTTTNISIAASNDAESLSLSTSTPILEGEEDGKVITATISGGEFVSALDKTHWTISNLPAGVSVGNVVATDKQTASITLSGNTTSNYDVDITSVKAVALADQYVDSTGDTSLESDAGITLTAKILPSVVTNEASNVQKISAVLSGSITSNGNAPITEQGFEYWEAGGYPTKAISSELTSDYSIPVTGLKGGTFYSYRAYAINSEGIARGSVVAFKTDYGVNVATVTGGTIVPSVTTTAAGVTITVTATPDSGKQLKAGTLKYTDGAGDHAIVGNSFVMPSANVTISAEFEAIPVTTYSVNVATVTGGTIVPSVTTTAAGVTVIITATPDSGKQLKAGTLKYTDGAGNHAIVGNSFVMPSANVTVSAEFEAISVTTYSVNVATVTGGTIVPSVTTAAAGATVTVTATPDSGKQLKAGTLKYTDGAGDHAIVGNSFVMPSANVTVSAEFEAISVTTYTVKFDKNGGTSEASPAERIASAGGTIVLPTPPSRTNYTFVSWNTQADGNGTAFTEATKVNGNITVYAQWNVVTTPSSGGGGASRGSEDKTATKVAGSSTINKVVTSTEANDLGKISTKVAVSYEEVESAVKAVIEKMNVLGQDNAQDVEIDITSDANANSIEMTLPKAAMASLSDANADINLKIKTQFAEITFDQQAIDTIAQENEDVTFEVTSVNANELSEQNQKLVGDNAVYDFKVLCGSKVISNFNGNVVLSLPYTLKPGENPNNVVVFYINENGDAESITNSVYDEKAGVVRFQTTHFSQYAVGYNAVTFGDVSSDDWYSEAVAYVSARGITIKNSGELFKPDEALTRGEFLVMVMRAYEIKLNKNAMDNFSDSGKTYYTDYLATAKALGIAHGVGKNLFLPDAEMSRQEMATFLYNVLEQINGLPSNESVKALDNYSDASSIASWATKPMTLLVEKGVINGYEKALSPTRKITRAEAAQVLLNLIGK